ncbi:S-layer homology domain-containing protein [Pelotomaculum sp. PtaB.Bin117]|uniref:S-layer homology domain-containing protein n=1 Tax=Pelotomaculum sp. PtaB.Bin117 TaxID=1811694 RepID=UPI0009C8BEBA|nr:S-layer homology domain-containing protein [Pelotomaculum sp. PtaB.Bin117]OPX91945.1 MAG: Cellulosome-anchoring protein precursor [Pelotomaculum sp. PtaB.Bin117]
MIIKRTRKNSLSFLIFFIFFFVVSAVWVWCRCLPALAAKAQDVVSFSDLPEHWARSHVTRLAALEMVKGYPDHTFKPDQLVNRLETVVLIVRSGGFAAEAEKLAANNNKKKNSANSASGVETKQTPKVPWGQSYIDLAVEKGFLAPDDPEDYDYAGPVTRLEVAELLARAMCLVPSLIGNESAPAENNILAEDGLSSAGAFSDLDTLEPEEQVYVAAVVNANVMSGYPDGTFRPQDTLTRAEIAVILSRLVDRGWVKIPDGRRLAGWIAGIEKNKDRRDILFNSLSGAQKLQVADNVQCFLAEEEESLEQAAGFRCEVILDGRRQVSWVNLLELKDDAVETEKIRGTVKMVALGEDNLMVLCDMNVKDLILPLAWDAVVSGGKASKGFGSLKQGDFVDVLVSQGQVRKVTLLDVKTASGEVKRIEDGRMYLKGSSSGKKPAWFNHYDYARIVDKDGIRQDSVAAGDKVKVTYLDPLPGEIDDEVVVEIKVTK